MELRVVDAQCTADLIVITISRRKEGVRVCNIGNTGRCLPEFVVCWYNGGRGDGGVLGR